MSGVAVVPLVGGPGEEVLLEEPVPINPNRWFFDKGRIDNTPSRRSGIDSDKELSYRQQAANFIQDIGQRLQVNQLCINTAIVYMHRFFMYHSFTHFHRNSISTASIFLAAKVEEQPRKLDHVIKVSHYCLHREQPAIDPKSDAYQEQSTELVMNENILLQTLGFDVAIDHPHTHVVKCCQLVRASKDLAQTSYFMATNSLHLTTMCLQYKPTVVACVCIHLACKWSSWEIPRSKEGKDWWMYVDETVTEDQLERLTADFLIIFNKSPSRLKRKIISLNAATTGGATLGLLNVPGIASLTNDSNPQSSSSANRSHSRSPSPKRPRVGKPGEGVAKTEMLMHQGMKPPPNHHSGPTKVSHPSSSMKQPLHPSKTAHLSSKDHHPQFNVKDPHHPHYQSQQGGRVGYPAPGLGHHPTQHGTHGHPAGTRPPSSTLPNAQVHHSQSGGVKGRVHPYPPGQVKPPPQQPPSTKQPLPPPPTQPPHLSQPNPHQPNPLHHTTLPNQNPALNKNHNQIHPHAKKPYERTDYMKREGQVGISSQQLQQPRTRPIDKPDGRVQQQQQQQQLVPSNHQNQVHSNSSSKPDPKLLAGPLGGLEKMSSGGPPSSLSGAGISSGQVKVELVNAKVEEQQHQLNRLRGSSSCLESKRTSLAPSSIGSSMCTVGSSSGLSVTSGAGAGVVIGPMRTTSLFSPDFEEEEEEEEEVLVAEKEEPIPSLKVRPQESGSMFQELDLEKKQKKKKKEKHKHKDKKEKKEHKKDRHKHKHKDRSSPQGAPTGGPAPDPDSHKIKIKLMINKGEKGGLSVGSSKNNANLRQ